MPRDDSLEKGYLEVCDDIVLGARRYSPLWEQWFSETSSGAKFENRIRATFDKYGHLPTPTQFYKLQAELLKTDVEPLAIAEADRIDAEERRAQELVENPPAQQVEQVIEQEQEQKQEGQKQARKRGRSA